ncbi:guanine nucleotide-binding protein subunit gamma 3 isoform X4 [Brachypodium distachyon]|uniref:guanine nucleotide-binding protein subunit gamma 3 isoform X4 n=1 Tax=Brachypodium distachyon TaxID=15368 RepID=UPI000D0CD1F3|nr:guanine nucleotide-binding protein subunit gamma 3 isoform X4 [Brachypodium distachyon]|eukprot:XP_024316760.1 guanine nucleotide-binding protein subunit gamma 3 isoform X4 [Brachypodium distachyon]
MMAMVAPRPKSPPASPDPCGRHHLQLAVDTLHREIGFLEGEISSVEGVHAASKCCKEVDEFVGKNADPFITMYGFSVHQRRRTPISLATFQRSFEPGRV